MFDKISSVQRPVSSVFTRETQLDASSIYLHYVLFVCLSCGLMCVPHLQFNCSSVWMVQPKCISPISPWLTILNPEQNHYNWTGIGDNSWTAKTKMKPIIMENNSLTLPPLILRTKSSIWIVELYSLIIIFKTPSCLVTLAQRLGCSTIVGHHNLLLSIKQKEDLHEDLKTYENYQK